MSDVETRSLERRLRGEGRLASFIIDALMEFSDDDFKKIMQEIMIGRDRLLTISYRGQEIRIKDLSNEQVVEALQSRFNGHSTIPAKESTILRKGYSASSNLKRTAGACRALVLEGYRRGLIHNQHIQDGASDQTIQDDGSDQTSIIQPSSSFNCHHCHDTGRFIYPSGAISRNLSCSYCPTIPIPLD